MVKQSLIRLLRRPLAAVVISSEQLFRCGQQGPSPAVFLAMLVERIDKILRHDVAAHLQACDIAVELTAHLGPRESAGGTQFTGDEAALLLERQQDGFLDAPLLGLRMRAAAIVAEVWPPLTADEPCLLREELAIDAVALRHHGTFPFPQRPVPSAVGEHHIAAVFICHFHGREAYYPAVQQGEEAYLPNQFHQVDLAVYNCLYHAFKEKLSNVLSCGFEYLACKGNVFPDKFGKKKRNIRIFASIK